MSNQYDEDDYDFDNIDKDMPEDSDLDALSEFDEAEAMRKHEEVMELLERIEEAIDNGFKVLSDSISKIGEKDEASTQKVG